MEWWNRLDPNQRKLLAIGVPVVAAAALISVLRRDDTAEEEEPAAGRPALIAAGENSGLVGGDGLPNADIGALTGLSVMITDGFGAIIDRLEALNADDETSPPVAGQPVPMPPSQPPSIIWGPPAPRRLDVVAGSQARRVSQMRDFPGQAGDRGRTNPGHYVRPVSDGQRAVPGRGSFLPIPVRPQLVQPSPTSFAPAPRRLTTRQALAWGAWRR